MDKTTSLLQEYSSKKTEKSIQYSAKKKKKPKVKEKESKRLIQMSVLERFSCSLPLIISGLLKCIL